MTTKTWLITGASSGLGRALAEYVLAQGDRAVITASSLDANTELASKYPDTGLALRLDVTDPQQRADGVAQAEAHFGGIDILVNNAAIDFIGTLEEQEEKDIRAQFEVNFFGAVALTRLVLPGMRKRHTGTIVNVTSMDGQSSLAGNGYYSASKFALEGFTESLWQEIEPLGLQAMVIEPGSFRTGIEKRTKISGTAIEDYTGTAGACSGRQKSPLTCSRATPTRPRRSSMTSQGLNRSATGSCWGAMHSGESPPSSTSCGSNSTPARNSQRARISPIALTSPSSRT